jgi:hypothetical protein
MLTQHTKETARHIRMLAIGGYLFDDQLRQYIASSSLDFGGLETLVLVVDGDARRKEKELIRENMEDHLVNARDYLRSLRDGEWKLPAVKVMDAQTLESQL